MKNILTQKFCRLIVKALKINLGKIDMNGYTELHNAVFYGT